MIKNILRENVRGKMVRGIISMEVFFPYSLTLIRPLTFRPFSFSRSHFHFGCGLATLCGCVEFLPPRRIDAARDHNAPRRSCPAPFAVPKLASFPSPALLGIYWICERQFIPAAFDPLTNGHLDLSNARQIVRPRHRRRWPAMKAKNRSSPLRNASNLFNSPWATSPTCRPIPLILFWWIMPKTKGAGAIIRGFARAVSDFEFAIPARLDES